MRLPFFHALCLLTIFPAPQAFYRTQLSPQVKAQSIMFYAAVGLVIAAVLSVMLLWLANIFPSFLVAALLLSAWVIATGALHLDGWADCCDAFFVHHKGANRTLAVMKEPQVGAMAAVGLVLLLLIKFSALVCLSASISDSVMAIFTACIGARLLAAHYILCTVYVSENGLVSGIDFKPYESQIAVTSGFSLLLVFIFCGVIFGLSLLLILTAMMLGWRQLWRSRIGGYSGDCVGALIELIECMTLILFVGFM